MLLWQPTLQNKPSLKCGEKLFDWYVCMFGGDETEGKEDALLKKMNYEVISLTFVSCKETCTSLTQNFDDVVMYLS